MATAAASTLILCNLQDMATLQLHYHNLLMSVIEQLVSNWFTVCTYILIRHSKKSNKIFFVKFCFERFETKSRFLRQNSNYLGNFVHLKITDFLLRKSNSEFLTFSKKLTFRTQFGILKQCVFLRVNGVEMVRFASNPEGGYLSKGMAKVGVRTSCVPGGKTRRFSCVIHKNRFWRLLSSSFDLEVKDEQVHNEIINSRSNHIIWKKNGKFFKKRFHSIKWPQGQLINGH